jgi:hypothetical protein
MSAHIGNGPRDDRILADSVGKKWRGKARKPTMRSVVLIHGLLRGMGREVSCEMLAIRDSQSEKSPAVYSRCSVIEAPRDLPDGDYTVMFSGYTVSAKKEGGLWIPDAATASPAREQKPRHTTTVFRVEEAAEILPALKRRIA